MKTQLKFQVYINGQAIRKSFTATSMNSIWNRYNNWVKQQGDCEIVDGDYCGQMAWKNHRGIIEIREVVEVVDTKVQIAQITKNQRFWLASKLTIAA
jgi:hypothetical protein